MSGTGAVEAQNRALHRTFKRFDRHNNGFVTKRDLKIALELAGYEPTMQEIEQMLQRIGCDPEHVTFEHFKQLVSKQQSCRQESFAWPSVAILKLGGTASMDPFDETEEDAHDAQSGGLKPSFLQHIVELIPEIASFAACDSFDVFAKDSASVTPDDWCTIASKLHELRNHYDGFVVLSGTDTMVYIASAVSFMLGPSFGKPVVFTGSVVPLAYPRNDARNNLSDAVACAVSANAPPEVVICFHGVVYRGCRSRKIHSTSYGAFTSPAASPLATVGVSIKWRVQYAHWEHILAEYKPVFNIEQSVMRAPIVPGVDPFVAYGDVGSRGIKGVVCEAFGVGNFPVEGRWLEWLKHLRASNVRVVLQTQCAAGSLHPEVYAAGRQASAIGIEQPPAMTHEAATVKLMLSLQFPDKVNMEQSISGEFDT